MAAILLPELPKGKEFEEYIAAHFNSAGFYVDRNVVLREGDASGKAEILELDIHVTDYRQTPPKMTLVELKSGNWGMGDVFKIRGWMDLLNLQSGLFVTMVQPGEISPCQKVANRLGIDLVPIANLTETPGLLGSHLCVPGVDERDVSIWRFSYWLEQKLIEDLKHKKKTQANQKRYTALDQYLFEINSGTFFCPTITDKADLLYDAFRRNPRITAKAAHEAKGESFDEEYGECPKDLYERTFYEAEYTDLQISMYVEHRARLAILKAAIDSCLYRKAGDMGKVGHTLKILGQEFPKEELLPESFKSALPQIQRAPYFYLYPVFWQWFLWIFGGFILKEHEEKEYSLLSQKTAIPVGNIPQALRVYDLLFPIPGEWFMDLKTNIRMMKMFPVPFMGVGANYRRYYHCPNGNFEELRLTNTNARKDITKWNNLLCDILGDSSRYKAKASP